MAEITVPEIDPDEVIDFMTVDTTDFGAFALADQIRHLEVEGFVAARYAGCGSYCTPQSRTCRHAHAAQTV